MVDFETNSCRGISLLLLCPNKFCSNADHNGRSAAQAWNRNDSRAAKALSLRGQSENNLMREAHREAARILYEGRNKDKGPNAKQLFVDLHGKY